ncbi:AAA family ATPase [Actinomyces vulturis]|uniref:AAA family ATPase n=1 Tax=Actinomyces vulturis TaxID=1857645 RepID=UPI000833B3BE|nr:AAA family ATPase [Actinomyces vulturis]
MKRPKFTNKIRALEMGDDYGQPPEFLKRSDGVGLLNRAAINYLFGDSESGKTWVALTAIAQVLQSGGKALIIDADMNGFVEVHKRLSLLGVSTEQIMSDNFQHIDPMSTEELRDLSAWLQNDSQQWKPEIVVIDTVDRIMALENRDSNNADDFTRMVNLYMKPMANSGACVVMIDHVAKNSTSRDYGARGTTAKKGVINGISIRVTGEQTFAPGRGGACKLYVHKDRRGNLRRYCARTKNGGESLAAVYEMHEQELGPASVVIRPALGNELSGSVEAHREGLVKELLSADPFPKSISEAQKVTGKRRSDVAEAYREAKKRREAVPSSLHICTEPGTSQTVASVPQFQHVPGTPEPVNAERCHYE